MREVWDAVQRLSKVIDPDSSRSELFRRKSARGENQQGVLRLRGKQTSEGFYSSVEELEKN